MAATGLGLGTPDTPLGPSTSLPQRKEADALVLRITWSRTSLWSDLEETLNGSMLTDKGLLQNAYPKPKPHSGWRVHCSRHGLFPTKLLRGPAHLVAKSRAPSVLISLDPLDVSLLSCFHTCVPTAQFFPVFFPDHPFCSSDSYS